MIDPKKNYGKIQLTEDDFKFFEEQCKLWLEVLGMTDYKIDFRFDEDDQSYASTQGSLSPRHYWINLSREWENTWEGLSEEELDKQKKKTLIDCAHHEAVECLMMRIRILAEARYIGDADIDDEIHCIIHKLDGAWDRYEIYKQHLER